MPELRRTEVSRLLGEHGLHARCVVRAARPFRPAEYDAYLPGLFAYLDSLARRRGRGVCRRRGSWRYLEVAFLEASSG